MAAVRAYLDGEEDLEDFLFKENWVHEGTEWSPEKVRQMIANPDPNWV